MRTGVPSRRGLGTSVPSGAAQRQICIRVRHSALIPWSRRLDVASFPARIATPTAPARPTATAASTARRNGSSRAAAGRDRTQHAVQIQGHQQARPQRQPERRSQGQHSQAGDPVPPVEPPMMPCTARLLRSQASRLRPFGSRDQPAPHASIVSPPTKNSNVAGSSSNSQVAPRRCTCRIECITIVEPSAVASIPSSVATPASRSGSGQGNSCDYAVWAAYSSKANAWTSKTTPATTAPPASQSDHRLRIGSS